MIPARTAEAAAPVNPMYAASGSHEATTHTPMGPRSRIITPTVARWNTSAATPMCSPLTAIR